MLLVCQRACFRRLSPGWIWVVLPRSVFMRGRGFVGSKEMWLQVSPHIGVSPL